MAQSPASPQQQEGTHVPTLEPACAQLDQIEGNPKAGLEEKLLQALRESGVPLKAPQLSKLCQVPKKEINRVLYRMKAERKVVLEGQATWRLADAESGGSTEQAAPSLDLGSIPEHPGPWLPNSNVPPGAISEVEENICKVLMARGPLRALTIAQALGMRTAKDVNPTLHRLLARQRLVKDPNSGTWRLNQSEDSGGRSQPHPNVIQKTPSQLAIIVQSESQSQNLIYIQNSKNICIGNNSHIEEQVSVENEFESPAMQPANMPSHHQDSSEPVAHPEGSDVESQDPNVVEIESLMDRCTFGTQGASEQTHHDSEL